MLENIMGQMEDSKEEDLDLKGHNEAFTEHFEESGKGDLRDNESYWRPWNPAKDKVQVARKGSTDVAKRYQANIKREVAAISTKLRSKFLIARQPQVQHGVRKGSGLSDRRLVDSTVELRSGRRATRPDWNKVNKGACTLAVGVVIDQSGSMNGINQVYAAQGAMAIAEPLDKLGAPVMVCGPRSGRWFQGDTWEEQREMDDKCGYNGDGTFHRSESVNIDLFKNWDERFNKCRDRFSTVSATGGTPLSDGIQYAMQELSDRTEVHRVIIVLTDGAANSPKVVNRQIRLAKEAGITVIGVGIGGYCGIVRTQFPANHIEIPDVKELPKKLLGMLENIMFPKRAKRAKMDGRIG
jgi:cobalamin biosynthesis protein CobT